MTQATRRKSVEEAAAGDDQSLVDGSSNGAGRTPTLLAPSMGREAAPRHGMMPPQQDPALPIFTYGGKV